MPTTYSLNYNRCHNTKTSLVFCALLLAAFSAIPAVFAQKVDQEKLETAIERSKASIEVIKAVAALPDGKGIPNDVIEKANMIGVVPDAFQLSLAISRGVRGHGVFSVRRESGWSLPEEGKTGSGLLCCDSFPLHVSHRSPTTS